MPDMFTKVLIANRGEIALRVIRACRELGIQTVAVYSEADRESLHVRFADDDVCIGPRAGARVYLNIPRIIAAAEITGADAIHPGYGFLAENADFAEIVRGDATSRSSARPPEQIRVMGDKAVARKRDDRGRRADRARHARRRSRTSTRRSTFAQRDRLPGDHQGGGRRRRQGHARRAPTPTTSRARSSSRAARRWPRSATATSTSRSTSTRPRHIEIQILGDTHGNVDPPRRARLLGAAPPPEARSRRRRRPALTPELRAARWARRRSRGAKAVDYVGAGTIEFLLDEDGAFYFMEMNTRIQVEHPVTEMVTGVDLVKEQIRVARGRAAVGAAS